VLGIFTGEHFKQVGGLPCGWLINSLDGTPMKEPRHPVLADGKVRYVGDRVALVVAETLEQAIDAAGAVQVRYDSAPAVLDFDAAKARAHSPGKVLEADADSRRGDLAAGLAHTVLAPVAAAVPLFVGEIGPDTVGVTAEDKCRPEAARRTGTSERFLDWLDAHDA
jgi:carbon-monoxide dehydrogenase large subunit